MIVRWKIAIVVDMWLTGFDVPSLATMYVQADAGYNLDAGYCQSKTCI